MYEFINFYILLILIYHLICHLVVNKFKLIQNYLTYREAVVVQAKNTTRKRKEKPVINTMIRPNNVKKRINEKKLSDIKKLKIKINLNQIMLRNLLVNLMIQ